MSKKSGWLILAIVCFIGLNLFLIYKKNSLVDRTNFLTQWTEVKAKDLENSIATEGVLDATETNQVYIDKNKSFKQFLVKKGQPVETGTPLFEYDGLDLEERRSLITSEQDRLRSEAASMDQLITELESLKSRVPSDSSFESSSFGADSDSAQDSQGGAKLQAYYDLAKTISEKEQEREKVQQQLDMYDEQLRTLQNGEGSLTVVSPYSGIVSNVSHELDNPGVTIVSKNSVVKGKLTEEQRSDVKNGDKAHITSKHFTGKLNGTVADVAELPELTPSTDHDSRYPFVIAADDAAEKDLLQGYHVKAEIVTKEAENANAVPVKSVVHFDDVKYLWVLNNKGIVEKRKVKTGIKDDGYIEVKNGVKKGSHIAELPDQVHKEGLFVTLMKPGRIKWDDDAQFEGNWKYMIMGILEP
ncbi:efflux RND transporter periplasmic adaptor subunit [Falsibacillus pallidus]|uniref:HlyD family secretion protein n=1 Tax=Falsibacillus pallidus TaxID=493781 RepID=A0A370G886_9BACI|nr:efflux RND transporter periplasmic adaptor subunit [Falsibacillus pallidus]RDI40015.1 HlyD family secretion protein [Falsibacillus pallidus]